MTLVTANFSVEEFNCRDCTPYPVNLIESRLKPLCLNLELIRSVFDKPIIILSGYRTPSHNKAIGGSKNSQHCLGLAADLMIKGISGRMLSDVVRDLIRTKAISQGGVGEYHNFCHYDIRGHNVRWRGL